MADFVKTSQVKLNPANPRIIRDEKYRKLVQSVAQFPAMLDVRGIVVDGAKMILGGNQRWRAILDIVKMSEQELRQACSENQAAMTLWEVIREKKAVPANWILDASQFTEDEIRRFIIADNVEFGEHDWDALANGWDAEELADWGVDVPNFDPEKQEAQEDDYEIPDEVETDIVPGDIFDIGPHRLLCGDSAKAEDVDRLMDRARADMVFTDPPYGVAIGAKNRMLNSFEKAGKNLTDIKDDALKPEDLKEMLLPAFTNLRRVMSDDCTVFVTAPQSGELVMMMMMMMKEAGLPVRHVLIWKKNAPTFSMGRLDYDYQHEPILLTWGKRHKYYGGGDHKTSVWEIDKPRSSKEHPTMKPVALVANALLNNSKNDNIVCDWYLGSGTTMVAAHQLGRRCYGMEIEPKYCQVIVDRMMALDPTLEVMRNGVAYKNNE